MGGSEVVECEADIVVLEKVDGATSAGDHTQSGEDPLILTLVGPTILQSLDCAHKLLCKSRVPHSFPEVQAIPWPGPKEVHNLGWELENLGLGISYLA